MEPADFKAWRKQMGMSQIAAAEALGLSKGSIELYEAGKRREDGRPVEIPKTVALACSAVQHGLQPFGAPMAVAEPDSQMPQFGDQWETIKDGHLERVVVISIQGDAGVMVQREDRSFMLISVEKLRSSYRLVPRSQI